jgi:glycosyltransferase involved in cell wall biosynthesis
MSDDRSPLVTAIVSTYASEEFIEGCLANLVRQSIFDRMEILVVDAASPEDEGRIVRRFQENYPNIRYIRTSERIGIYHAWNIGVREAKGKYLTNANTDDRRHPGCTEKLVLALEEHPESVLAYSDILITHEKNSEFDRADVVDTARWLDYDHVNLMRRCEVGPMPVWRACLHDELGLFDERYFGAGDYEFWLRASERHSFIHVKEPLGLYLRYDNNLETRNMVRKLNEEYLAKSTYIQRFMGSDLSSQESARLLAVHSQAVTDMVNIGDQEIGRDDLNRFEYHYYACALLLAMNGRKDDAVSMLEDWLRNINTSKNIGHLLYALILQGRTSHTSSHPSKSRVSFVVFDDAHPELLGRTMSSLLEQEHHNWELTLISDDPQVFENRLSSLTTYPHLGKNLEALPAEKKKCVQLTERCGAGDRDFFQLVPDILNNSLAEYVCVLHAGEVLSPNYISDAAASLDTHSDAGWVSPKVLFFGTYAFPAFGTDFSLAQALAEPPSPGASLFRKEAWIQAEADEHCFSGFEKWGLWLGFALAGWNAISLPGFGVVRNMIHGENLLDRRQKTLRRMIAVHSHWYHRDSSGAIHINKKDVHRFESAPGREARLEVVRSMERDSREQAGSGRLRLAGHYLQKKNVAKAREQLERILCDDPDNTEAKKLLESCS